MSPAQRNAVRAVSWRAQAAGLREAERELRAAGDPALLDEAAACGRLAERAEREAESLAPRGAL